MTCKAEYASTEEGGDGRGANISGGAPELAAIPLSSHPQETEKLARVTLSNTPSTPVSPWRFEEKEKRTVSRDPLGGDT